MILKASFVFENIERYKQVKENRQDTKGCFISGMDFDKYVNHTLKKAHPWINDCGSKARKKAIMNAETAFKKFFKGVTKYPKFKKKRQQKTSLYFPQNNPNDIVVNRHRIKIPTLGWVKLKEYGYIPLGNGATSVYITQKADRY